MAEVSVLYDREGRTLTVWFSDRHQEYICEETGDEVVLHEGLVRTRDWV